jgi:hypothetical protein
VQKKITYKCFKPIIKQYILIANGLELFSDQFNNEFLLPTNISTNVGFEIDGIYISFKSERTYNLNLNLTIKLSDGIDFTTIRINIIPNFAQGGPIILNENFYPSIISGIPTFQISAQVTFFAQDLFGTGRLAFYISIRGFDNNNNPVSLDDPDIVFSNGSLRINSV